MKIITHNNIAYEVIHSYGNLYYLKDESGLGRVYDTSIDEIIHGEQIRIALGSIPIEIKGYYTLMIPQSIKPIIKVQLELF